MLLRTARCGISLGKACLDFFFIRCPELRRLFSTAFVFFLRVRRLLVSTLGSLCARLDLPWGGFAVPGRISEARARAEFLKVENCLKRFFSGKEMRVHCPAYLLLSFN